MGEPKGPLPVKLITGFIFKDENLARNASKILVKKFGRIDFKSPTIAFDHTDYYENELGKGLSRKFISFEDLIQPDTLPRIKIITNKIEKEVSKGLTSQLMFKSFKTYGRRINIDPGYLNLAKLVLASTKDYKHRIYLGKGIYSEIALFYENRSFRPWDWTYPDYRTDEYIAIFHKIRDIYAAQIKPKSCIRNG